MTTGYTVPDMTAFATENDIAAIYETEGMTTGFHYYAPAGGTFPNWAALLLIVKAEGFFTGFFPKKYYTPAQADILSGLTFVLGLHNMDGVEYMMRTEGITTGDFLPSGSIHSPGEAACDILQELSDHGYVSGTIETAIDSEPALSDTGCNDGRRYETCCLEPWTELVENVIPNVHHDTGDWTANAVPAFSHTFLCDVKIFAAFYIKGSNGIYGMRIKVDGVVKATYDTSTYLQTQNDFCYFTEFTLAGSAVAQAFTFEYVNQVPTACSDSHIYMIAYKNT